MIIEDNKIYIKLKKSSLKLLKEEEINEPKTHLNDHFIIIGGGLSGMSAIESLINTGFGGKITLVTNENTLPYDRILLSKNLDLKENNILIRN